MLPSIDTLNKSTIMVGGDCDREKTRTIDVRYVVTNGQINPAIVPIPFDKPIRIGAYRGAMSK
jgi:hypothetical protein